VCPIHNWGVFSPPARGPSKKGGFLWRAADGVCQPGRFDTFGFKVPRFSRDVANKYSPDHFSSPARSLFFKVKQLSGRPWFIMKFGVVAVMRKRSGVFSAGFFDKCHNSVKRPYAENSRRGASWGDRCSGVCALGGDFDQQTCIRCNARGIWQLPPIKADAITVASRRRELRP